MRIAIRALTSWVAIIGVQSAALACELDDVIGYTLVAKKTVESHRDLDGNKNEDFLGCVHGRIVIFSDATALKCNTDHYQYSYKPEAFIFRRTSAVDGSSDWKMCVGGKLYGMSQTS